MYRHWRGRANTIRPTQQPTTNPTTTPTKTKRAARPCPRTGNPGQTCAHPSHALARAGLMGGDDTIRKAIDLALATTRAVMTLTGEVPLPADRTRRVQAAGDSWVVLRAGAVDGPRAGAEGRCTHDLAAVPRREPTHG